MLQSDCKQRMERERKVGMHAQVQEVREGEENDGNAEERVKEKETERA